MDYITMTYFIIFVPIAYITYHCLQAFDYQKILRRGRIGELRFLILIISVGLAHLFASCVVEILERISNFIV